VLGRFLEAGRGLAAAHAAGLVHRDFKPENVLIGNDGRVRVADFGLARLARSDEVERNDHLALSLTADGSRMGTPAYMSPEQHRGEAIDAQSDQFSFCVALYYGLYRMLPFTGDSWDELAESASSGNVPVPSRSDVPLHVQRALIRGLNVERRERFGSMEELLSALEQEPVRRPRWPIGALAIAVVASLSFFYLQQEKSPCRGAGQMPPGVWDEAKKAAVARRSQEPAFREIARAFDAFAASWRTMSIEACESANALRSECLGDQLRAARALSDRFVETDVATDNAARAVKGLSDLSACADPDALALLPPAEVKEDVARVDAIRRTGCTGDGLETARALAVKAKALGHLPTQAEAMYAVGVCSMPADLDAAEQSLREAALAASRAGHHRLESRASVALMEVLAMRPKIEPPVVEDPPPPEKKTIAPKRKRPRWKRPRTEYE
jgi:hypothetical protein